MHSMKKLLVPVDFSPESKQALRYAVALAAEVGGTVVALHVIEDAPENENLLTFVFPPETWPFFDVRPSRSPIDLLLKERALDLWNFLDHAIPKYSKVTIRRLIRIGSLGDEILRAARQENIDMIVLELRNRFLFSNRARRKLLRMIERFPYPVLLAPRESAETPSRGKPVHWFRPIFAPDPA